MPKIRSCNSGLPLPLVRYCKFGSISHMNGTNEMACHCRNECGMCKIPGTQYWMHPELRNAPITSAAALNIRDAVQKDTNSVSKAAKERGVDNGDRKTNTSRSKTDVKKKGPVKKLTKLRAGAPRAKHS